MPRDTTKRGRWLRAHDNTVVKMFQMLRQEHPNDEICLNLQNKQGQVTRRSRTALPGTNFYPDLMNLTKKKAYEVHWAGKRKENHRDDFPPGWELVNVFIADIWERENYVFNLSGEHVHITDKDWKRITR